MDETLTEIHRFLIKLEDPNKIERKRNLQKIQDVIQTKYPLPPKDKPSKFNHREVCTLWTEKLHSPLLRSLRDESERVREISAEIILYIFGHMVNSSPMTLSYIIPVLKQRLVHQPEDEVIGKYELMIFCRESLPFLARSIFIQNKEIVVKNFSHFESDLVL